MDNLSLLILQPDVGLNELRKHSSHTMTIYEEPVTRLYCADCNIDVAWFMHAPDGPKPYIMGDDTYLDIRHPIGGWQAVIYREGIGAVQTSPFFFDTPQEAYKYAWEWGEDDNIPVRFRTREELAEMAKGGDVYE